MCKKRKKVLRKRKGSKKGPAFERVICKQLGLWWTEGKRDDLFWRTANSGGRATVRGSQGTFGQDGDIQATDPIGQPLMDLMSLELKCGYPKVSLLDCLEKTQPKEGLYAWIKQAQAAAARSGAIYWAVIWKRNRRESVIFFPQLLGFDLRAADNSTYHCLQRARMSFQGTDLRSGPPSMVVLPLSDFLGWCTPDMIRSVLAKNND